MWEIYLDSKTWGIPPSQRLKVPPLRNDWAAWQFDGAVLWAGLTIENALQWSEGYQLEQILAPDFRLRRGQLWAMVAANPGIVSHWKEGS